MGMYGVPKETNYVQNKRAFTIAPRCNQAAQIA